MPRSSGKVLPRTAQRSEEGAVMLIVLLVLLTATALATAALQGTQFELRSSGYNRAAVQMEYVSEAAATNTVAWIDAISPIGRLTSQLSTGKPINALFGEPEIPTDNPRRANRTTWLQQAEWSGVPFPPITNADKGLVLNGVTDRLGTFGPRSAYIAGLETTTLAGDQTEALVRTNYVVDLYDCRELPNTASAGNQVNQGGSGTLKQVQYYCVVTSRGRSYVPRWSDPTALTTGNKLPRKSWSIAGGTAYEPSRFTMAHDARGTIITPPVPLQ